MQRDRRGNLPNVGEESLAAQTYDSSSESDDSSENVGEETSGSIWALASIETATPFHKRRLDIRGDKDEELRSERIESDQKWRKDPVSLHDYGVGAASQKPKTVKPKKPPPQDPSTKCRQCFQGRRACDQAKPDCGTCVKRGRVCAPQKDQPPHPTDPDPNFKCDRCVHDRLVCDQIRPQCGNCQERQGACRYQQKPQPSRQVRFYRGGPQPSRDARFGQDPAEKCYNCFHGGYRCDGKTPCGRCVKTKVALCRPQGAKQKRLKGIPLGDRCWPCRRKYYMCNGEKPCNICLKAERQCYKDKPSPSQSGYRCMNCEAHGYLCDGATPCNTCIRTGKSVCKHETDDGFIERHYDIKSVNNEVYEDCLGCVRHKNKLARPMKIPCDKKRPCGNCLATKREKSCCYQVEPGLKIWISKRGDAATRWKHKARESNDADSGEETSNDDMTSQDDSVEFDSDEYDDLYKDSQNSAEPSRER